MINILLVFTTYYEIVQYLYVVAYNCPNMCQSENDWEHIHG